MVLRFEEITSDELIRLLASAEADGYRGEGFNPGNQISIFASTVINDRGEKSMDSMNCVINYGCKESRAIAINFSYERRRAWGHIVRNGEDPKFFQHWINEEERAGRMGEIDMTEIEFWLNS